VSAATGGAFLLLVLAAGVFLTRRLLDVRGVTLLMFGSLVGIVAATWAVYLLASVLAWAHAPAPLARAQVGVCALLVGSLVLWLRDTPALASALRDSPARIGAALLCLAIGAALMVKTFRSDASQQLLLISTKVYSDFASHVPMIRSFSLGENVPAEYPLFAGPPIRYHFLFYAFAGLAERAGLPIDWAVNLPSLLGFAALLIAIVDLADTLYPDGRRWVGPLAIMLFLTASSLSAFTEFEWPKELTLASVYRETLGRTSFLNSGPYADWDGTITGLFWNLNVFTNQRHFAFGIALGLMLFTVFLRTDRDHQLSDADAVRRLARAGVLLGLLPLFHGVAFAAFLLVSALLWPWCVRKRAAAAFVLIPALVAVPQWLSRSMGTAGTAVWHPGYGLAGRITLGAFLLFWTQNLGLKFLSIPVLIGWLRGQARHVFLAALALFVLPNLIRFGPDAWTNHKWFTIWLVFVDVALAACLVRMCARPWPVRIGVVVLTVGLSATGWLDLPPIFNDKAGGTRDWQVDPIARFLVEHAAPREPIATSYHVYHPASLTGRPILLGWPYFVSGAGYPVREREAVVRELFETGDPDRRCALVRRFGARYLVAGRTEQTALPYRPNWAQLDRTLDRAASDERYIVYDASRACGIPLPGGGAPSSAAGEDFR